VLVLSNEITDFILGSTSLTSIEKVETVQALWGGYGQLLRVHLEGSDFPSLVVKIITPPELDNHPRGWNTITSNQRKLKSYQVEKNWYNNYNEIDLNHRFPKCIATKDIGDAQVMLLEDLQLSNLHPQASILKEPQIRAVLDWLASFHAYYLGKEPVGLWDIGTYWHLDTRPDEYERMQNQSLKLNATKWDDLLNNAQFKTIVHGDAKQANFCFSEDNGVAAVDFQYVGGGAGVKDVAYFLCGLGDQYLIENANVLIKYYFDALSKNLNKRQFEFTDSLIEEWRNLYPIAVADFARFMNGWGSNYREGLYVDSVVESVL